MDFQSLNIWRIRFKVRSQNYNNIFHEPGTESGQRIIFLQRKTLHVAVPFGLALLKVTDFKSLLTSKGKAELFSQESSGMILFGGDTWSDTI